MTTQHALTATAAAYVAAIVLANVLTNTLGLVPAGFGLLVPAGTYAAGFALLLRDAVQTSASSIRGRKLDGILASLAAIAVAGGLAALLASPTLAVASSLAFVAAEVVDLAVFTPARERFGFAPAALASNVVSAPVDTVAFLVLAGFPLTAPAVVGQLVAKVAWSTTVPLLALVAARRAVARRAVLA